MTPLQRILDALRTAGCDPKKSGDEWSARCPAHEDQHPSLSIGKNDAGDALVHCHAGCETSAVLKALGMTQADLSAKRNGQSPRRSAKRPRPKAKKTSTKAKAQTPRPKIVATYDYRDEKGAILFQVVRYSDKSFPQRQPDGKGGWTWSVKGVRRVLYHLPEILNTSAESLIFVCEGEKDVDRLRSLGLIATTHPGGAGKWSKVEDAPLHGHHIVIIADNDEPGRGHALDVLHSLYGKAATMCLLKLPGLTVKGDVSDWIDADPDAHDCDELVRLAEAAPEWTPEIDEPTPAPANNADGDEHDDEKGSSEHASQSAALIGIVDAENVELFHSTDCDGKALATITTDQHAITLPVHSRLFRRWLARRYYILTKGVPNSRAMIDALAVIEAKAIYDGPGHETYVRLAERNDVFYLDLGGPEYNYVEVDRIGWRIVSSCDAPVRFIRKAGMLSIPEPVHGVAVDSLRSFLNVNDDQFVLVLAYLVAALSPRGPHPVLVLNGEAGSAKTTAARIIRKLIDPNKALVRAAPHDARDLIIAASNSWLVSFDNLSRVQPWLSDALCRLSTGGGFATRELYSDDSETIFDAHRPVILNGIENIATRGDLLDRAVSLMLEPIPESDRVDERALWRRFEKARPGILGALFDAVSCGLKRLDEVHLDKLPRMADFCQWAVACSPALGLGDGEIFLKANQEDRDAGRLAAIDFEPTAEPLIQLIQERRMWSGSFSDLLHDLEEFDEGDDQSRRRKGWPKSARGLSGALRRIAPELRAVGVFIDFPDHRRGRGARGRVVTITYREVGAQPSTSAQPSTFGADDSPKVISGGRSENGNVQSPSTRARDRPPENRAHGAKNADSAHVDDVDGCAGDIPPADDTDEGDILDGIPY